MTIYIDSTDGVKVALHDLGGSGPLLLIIHATGFHAHCYEPIARRVADHFHVVAPDLRGHGDSVMASGTSMDWWNMAADLGAVVKHLDVDSPIRAVGHSMGGATILMTELTTPGTFSDAWLYEPIVIPEITGMPPNPMADNARRRKGHFTSLDEVFERYSSRPPFDGILPEALWAYIRHGFADDPNGGVVLKCPGEIEAQVFESTAHGLFPRLPEIATRLTIVGSGDNEMPASVAPQLADAIPGANFVEWPDNSHFGPFEDPDEAARQIIETLL